MIRPEIMQAIAGGGLTAQDYAGLTPEQIQAVAGHGQHDRNALFGVVQNMQQAEMQTRKQDFDELHQNRTFQLMQDQERRAQFQTLVDMGFKAAAHQLDQRRLQLENMRTQSAMNVDEAQRKKLDLEIEDIRKQRERVSMLDNTYIEVPIKDKDGKPTSMMSLGALFAGGSEFANTAFKFAVAKNLGGTGFDGSSGIPGLGGGSGESNAEQVRAIKRQMFLDQGLDPKAAHIMSTLDNVLTTPEKVYDQIKNDKLITMMPPEQLKARIENMVYQYNDWVYKTYTGKNQAEWKAAAKTRAAQQGGETVSVNPNDAATSLAAPKTFPQWLEEQTKNFGSSYEGVFANSVVQNLDIDLNKLTAQHPVTDLDGKQRYIDFAYVDGPIKIAIENDGYDKTGRGTGMSKEEFIDWQRRQAALTAQGWTVIRFANEDITKHPERVQKELSMTIKAQEQKFQKMQKLVTEVQELQSTAANTTGTERKTINEKIQAKTAQVVKLAFDSPEKLDAMLDPAHKKAMEEKYPEWFQYSETYGRKTLKPNVVNLIAKEIGGRTGTFVNDAAMDINQFLLELMQKDPLANRLAENKDRAAYMKGVVNR